MTNSNLAQRLSFLQIDDGTRAALAEFMPIATKSIPDILNAFYTHLRTTPQMAAMFGGSEDERHRRMHSAADAQTRHWLNLFSGRFDDEYYESARRIGLRHSRIGLEPQWYIGGYSFTLTRIYGLISHAHTNRLNPAKAQESAARMLRAVTQAVMLDIDLSLSIYIEENRNTFNATLNDLANNFVTSVKDAVGSVADAAAKGKERAVRLDEISTQVREQLVVVAAASEEATVNIKVVANSTEELNTSSHEISKQMENAAAAAKQAVEATQRTIQTVESLTTAAQKIGDVVELIQRIAKQTNLLALNATIEAARAGEAGKGFAVVAGEVKQLAKQTETATAEISSQISNIQHATNATEAAIKAIGEKISQIDGISVSSANAVHEQTTATGEIAQNISQAAEGSAEINKTISSINSATVRTAETSREAMQGSTILLEMSAKLDKEVDKFIGLMKKTTDTAR